MPVTIYIETKNYDWSYDDQLERHLREPQRDAQRQLEDAASLVGVLLDAVEQDSDTRAAQTRTVLEFTVECLHKAHHLIDEQESCDVNLFLEYFELKGGWKKGRTGRRRSMTDRHYGRTKPIDASTVLEEPSRSG